MLSLLPQVYLYVGIYYFNQLIQVEPSLKLLRLRFPHGYSSAISFSLQQTLIVIISAIENPLRVQALNMYYADLFKWI